MSYVIASLRSEILDRINVDSFYGICRSMDMTEEEISVEKFLNLSKEDKYQLILRAEKENKTPREIYEIIDDPWKWRDFIMRQRWDSDLVRFSGNKIRQKSKEKVVNAWLAQDENCDVRSKLEELLMVIDECSMKKIE